MTIRELRWNKALAPGGADYEQLVRAYMPFVHGTALVLLPENPATVTDVVTAVFQTFALRWRKEPKRTLLATWFLRTSWFVVRKARKQLQLPAPPKLSVSAGQLALFNRLDKLPPKLLDPLIVRLILQESASRTAHTLRIKERRVEKRTARAVIKLAKAVRKFPEGPRPVALLESLNVPVPLEMESEVLNRLRSGTERREKNELTRAAARAWRGIAFGRNIRRLCKAGAAGIAVLLCVGLALAWLLMQGYLSLAVLRFVGGRLVKETPGLAEPAKPWPTEAEQRAELAAPKTAAELYNLTNIWPCHLSFTESAWNRLQPGRVPLAKISQSDGEITLRNPKARRNGLAGVIGLEFNWSEAQFRLAQQEFPRTAVRYRGNGTFVNSLFGPKQSFKLDLNKHNKAQNLAGVRTLNFVNSIPDNTYMHDALAERFFRDLGVPAPRTAFAYLTVDAPGSLGNRPLGLYVMIENIDDDFALDRFGSKKVPIFKPVTSTLFKDLGTDWKEYAGIYDLKTKATPDQLKHLIDFAHLVSQSDDAEFARRLSEFLDLEQFAGFLAGHVLTSSYDGFLSNGQNFYMYLDPKSNRFGFIPWDHDHGWGEFGYVSTNDRREQASIWDPCTYDNRFLNRVLKVETFRDLYRQTLERALRELFTVDRLYQQIDQVAAVIRPAIAAESDFRLHRFEIAVSTNWLEGARDGAPEGPKAPVHQMKRFIANRVKSVRDQLDGKAQGVILRGH